MELSSLCQREGNSNSTFVPSIFNIIIKPLNKSESAGYNLNHSQLNGKLFFTGLI